MLLQLEFLSVSEISCTFSLFLSLICAATRVRLKVTAQKMAHHSTVNTMAILRTDTSLERDVANRNEQ